MQSKLKKMRQLLGEKTLDAILVSNASTLTYLTGFPFTKDEREAYFLVTKNNVFVMASILIQEEVQKLFPDFIYANISSVSPKSFSFFVKEYAKKEHLLTIGIEADTFSLAAYIQLQDPDIRYNPLELASLRRIKDDKEMKAIEKACNLTDKAFSYILGEMKPGLTERQVIFLLETYIRKNDAQPAFDSIVAFGKHAAVPHHLPDKTNLKAKDIVLLDFGVRYENYCSDMTRTVFIGNPTREEKKVYDTVRVAQQKAIDTISNNSLPIPASNVDKVAREYIMKKGYSSFPHSLGHSIGIEVHDGFRLSPLSQTQLEENMVFSIEPGIYLSGDMGVRIEDIVALSKQGTQVLTKSTKELIVL